MQTDHEPSITSINQDITDLNGMIDMYKSGYAIHMQGLQYIIDNYDDVINNGSEEDIQQFNYIVDQTVELYTYIIKAYNLMKNKATSINNLIAITLPKQDGNRLAIEANVQEMITEVSELNQAVIDLNAAVNQPDEFASNYDDSLLKTTSNLYQYALYFIFFCFIIGCLIVVYMFPAEASGNLDYFILGLAGIIAVYYIYTFYKSN